MNEQVRARVELEGALCVLTIDHPPLNLLDARLQEDLHAALSQLEAGSPRAVLLRAEGRIFSGGVDVHLFAEQPDAVHAANLWERLIDLTQRLEALECPTVFAAHGLCLTWAFELALACDIVMAARSARFGLVEKVIGLTPAMGGTQRLAERIGSGRARELVMTGVPYEAETLERWNVVNRVLPDEGFDDAVRAFATELAEGPTLAHRATKRILAAHREGGVRAADERTPRLAADLFDSSDLRRGVGSFLSDGPGRASFEGR
jgi:enoyl-CoA hydratase/carnithine racemase